MTNNSHDEASADLERINADLRELVRARDDFLAIAAHELRSPMHALLLQIGNVLTAARRGVDADVITRLEHMKLAIEDYVRRATTLLEVSRVNAGESRLRLEEVDLSELVRRIVELYAAEAAFNRTQLRASVPHSLVGHWDRQALEQIVTNLISNAIKYGDGKPVDIQLERLEHAAQLRIQDSGIGISVEDQARIFNRFEQLITRQPRSGFGVGLWLVRNLVDAHRGSIQVDSEPGCGAIFTVRLPFDSSISVDAT